MPPVFDLEAERKFQVGNAFRTDPGAEVRVMTGGRVVDCSDSPDNPTNLDRYVIVEHTAVPDVNAENAPITYFSLYAMLGDLSVAQGDVVNSGTVIGAAGPSGPMSAIETNATLLFAVYIEVADERLEARWGRPTAVCGKLWFGPAKEIGHPFRG
jgi:murein DD-endopeptidase MepM/ murein hydrolase activator NlpD